MNRAVGWFVAVWFIGGAVGPETGRAQAAVEESLAGQSPAERFVEAGRLYQEGAYSEAADAYTAILSEGSTAPQLEYNLGNAHLKSGAVGRAILHYRRALVLDPGYEDALENLDYARSLTRDVRPELDSGLGMSGVDKLRLGPLAAAVATLIAFVGFFVVAGARLTVWRGRSWALVVQGGFAFATILSAGALLFEWSQVSGRSDGVLLVPEVEVRAGPGENHTIGFRLHEGTEVEILRAAGEWREVKVSEDLQGWVPKDVVEPI